MNLYLLFIGVAVFTIALPGPGVILTISNSLRYGVVKAIPGIFGIAFGTLCVALLSTTSLSLILSTSAIAFTSLKLVGAAYLMYFGIKHWRSGAISLNQVKPSLASNFQRFIEGLSITLLNPKAYFFYLSLFPQFIDADEKHLNQFVSYSLTFSLLLVVIHLFYGVLANTAKIKFTSKNGGKYINKISGMIFVGFGLTLAMSNK